MVALQTLNHHLETSLRQKLFGMSSAIDQIKARMTSILKVDRERRQILEEQRDYIDILNRELMFLRATGIVNDLAFVSQKNSQDETIRLSNVLINTSERNQKE